MGGGTLAFIYYVSPEDQSIIITTRQKLAQISTENWIIK